MTYLDRTTTTFYEENQGFCYGGREYAADVVTAELFESLGFEKVTDELPPNSKLWFTSGRNGDGEWESYANDLVNAKASELAKVKRHAAEILAHTDYAVLEASELGESIPSDIAAHRTEVKDVCAKRETDIQAAASTDELSLAITNSWPWPTPYGEPRES